MKTEAFYENDNISEVVGDALSHPRGIIAHGCNALGIMGAGIALQIRKRFPEAYKQYTWLCSRYPYAESKERVLMGTVQLVEVTPELTICNAFTQLGVGGKAPASLDAVEYALAQLYEIAAIRETEVAMPLIGCGLGGLSWENEVSHVVDELVWRFDVPTTIYHFPV